MIIHDTIRSYYKEKSLKKATNLTLNTEVLAEAKKLGINISKACDAFLESLVRQEKDAAMEIGECKIYQRIQSNHR